MEEDKSDTSRHGTDQQGIDNDDNQMMIVSTTKTHAEIQEPIGMREEPKAVLTKERKTPGVSVRMILLPEGYEPNHYDVLCGRGRHCKNWPGNLAYRKLIRSRLQEYSVTEGKNAKGQILDSVVAEIREKSAGGGFIKKDEESGRWYEVGDFLAKEKTSQCFRDALHEQYTSSAHAKYKRRKREHVEMIEGKQAQGASTESTRKQKRVGLLSPILGPTDATAHPTGPQNHKNQTNAAPPAAADTARIDRTQIVTGAAARPSDASRLGQPILGSGTTNDVAAQAMVIQRQLALLRGQVEEERLRSQIDALQKRKLELGMTNNNSTVVPAASTRQQELQARLLQSETLLGSGSSTADRVSRALPGQRVLPTHILRQLLGSPEDVGMRSAIGSNNTPHSSRVAVDHSPTTRLLTTHQVLTRLTGATKDRAGDSIDSSVVRRGAAVSAATLQTASMNEVQICALQPSLRKPGESPLDATQQVISQMKTIALRQQRSNQGPIDLFVLPELAPIGYSEDTFQNYLPDSQKNREMYRHIDLAFANAAGQLGASICYGTIGWDEASALRSRPVCYIRQKVIDGSGQIIVSYDKVHLCDYGECAETRFFTPGSQTQRPAFSIGGIRFGILICADMRYPVFCQRLVCEERIDVLLQPAAFLRDISFRTWKSFRETRAVENSVYFVGVNYAGAEFGETSVCPPWIDDDREPVSMDTEVGYLISSIDRGVLLHARTTMPFYRNLMKQYLSSRGIGSSSEESRHGAMASNK